MIEKHTPGTVTLRDGSTRRMNIRPEYQQTPVRAVRHDPDKNCVEFHDDGYHLGTWIDSDYDGDAGPLTALFCAAPELLGACRAALRLLEGHPGTRQLSGDAPAFAMLRAAIAKAGG